MKGTRSLTTNAVGIRRQAGRGADGCRTVDRFRRAVGVVRAAVAEEGAALSVSRSEAAGRPAGVAGDLVCAAHRGRVAASAARARLRLRVSCWRRLDEWQRAGVWDQLHALLLERLRAAGEIEWSRAVVDSTQVQAKKGAPKRARARSTEAVPAPTASPCRRD